MRAWIFLAAAAALFLCLPAAGGGLSACPGLTGSVYAQDMPSGGINNWGDGEEFEENPVYRFLKAHGTIFFCAVPVAMFILYVVIIGPTDVGNALRYPGRRNRFGGFGTNGGFGGRPSGTTDIFK
jgi:hypothetical protein